MVHLPDIEVRRHEIEGHMPYLSHTARPRRQVPILDALTREGRSLSTHSSLATASLRWRSAHGSHPNGGFRDPHQKHSVENGALLRRRHRRATPGLLGSRPSGRSPGDEEQNLDDEERAAGDHSRLRPVAVGDEGCERAVGDSADHEERSAKSPRHDKPWPCAISDCAVSRDRMRNLRFRRT